VATVTAGGMALAGGRGYNTVNEPNNVELRPSVHVESKVGGVEVVEPIDDGLTGRVIQVQQSDSSFELPPLNPPPMKNVDSDIEYVKNYIPLSEDFDAYTTQDFDKMMEDHVDFQEHNFGQTYSLLRLDVWSNGKNISHDLEYKMIEPKEDSKLSANVIKFEVLKEYVMSFYPKLENCTIRTDSGKHSSFQSPFLEFRLPPVLKPTNLSNRTMYAIMPADESEILQRVTSYNEGALEPAVGHLGFRSPSASNIGQHWAIVVSRSDRFPGYFPFAKLTEKSFRILEDLIPKTKPEHQYKMCLTFLDL